MAENQNTAPKDNAVTAPHRGMMKDLSDTFIPEGVWTHATNAVKATVLGKKGGVSNEQGNLLCVDVELKVFHIQPLYEDRYAVFSTDDDQIHEIGIFNESDCSYHKVVRSQCFTFNTKYTVTSAVRRRLNDIYLYWQHQPGPDRVLNLSDVPYKTVVEIVDGCKEETLTNELDCQKTLLTPLVKIPTLYTLKGNGGQLPNGMYQAAIAYSNDGVRETEYIATSLPASIWSKKGGNSVEIHFSDLDESYDEFELVLVTKIGNQTVVKEIGTYSTASKVVTIDAILASARTIPLSMIYQRNLRYPSSDKMHALNGYLIRSGVRAHVDPNYQILANQIETRWVEVKYPEKYYAQGGQNVGYMRDEVYSYFIRWVYTTGARTASYHIPGRPALQSEKSEVSDNVFDNARQTWQVRDTSTRKPPNTTNPGDITQGGYLDPNHPVNGATGTFLAGDTGDGGEVVATGKMQYWESSEKYPDNKPEVWGELCGQNIRHHKFPGNSTSPHFSKTQGKRYIHVLGVQFLHIPHPVDKDGNPIEDIVGYEILRGSREGNKSIVAKGMFNATLNYYNPAEKINGMIQNFPFNSLRPNKFLRTAINEGGYDSHGGALDSYNLNRMSFHSPDTTFQRPNVSNLRVRKYMDIAGKARGKFETSYKHPEHKLLSGKWLKLLEFLTFTSAIVNSVGKQTSSADLNLGFLGSGTSTTYEREDGPITAPVSLGLGSMKLIPSGAMSVVMFAANYSMWAKFGFRDAYRLIENLLNYKQYAYQYNGVCLYDEAIVGKNLLQNLDTNDSETKYVSSGLQDVNDNLRLNNIYRSGFLHVAMNKNMTAPSVQDETGKTLSEYDEDIYDALSGQLEENSSASYGALMVDYQNQYGQIDSVRQLPIHSGVYETKPTIYLNATPVLFGGDTYISKYSEKNPYVFFNTWLMGDRDGQPFNYKNYVNGPAPRYWADFTPWNPDEIKFSLGRALFNVTVDLDNTGKMSGYPSKHHLERSSIQRALEAGVPWNQSYFRVEDDEDKAKEQSEIMRRLGNQAAKSSGTITGSFYLSANGIREFFVESEFNLDFREDGEKPTEKFWGESSSRNIDHFFRMDRITEGNFFKYDYSLLPGKFHTALSSAGFVQSRSYDPLTDEQDHSYYPLRSIYSLQQSSDLKRDNWKIFLANNYKDFESPLNNIKALNKTGALILFEDSEPKEMMGVDTLQTDGGTKVTVGDGGLFQQPLRSPANADDVNAYGSSSSHNAAVNTPFGLFYVSERNGKIMHMAGQIRELRAGMTRFLEHYVPLQIRKDFPNFNNYDNLVSGAGWSAVYDQQYELVYFTKKDYRLKDVEGKVKYDPITRRFFWSEEDFSDINISSSFNNVQYMSEKDQPGESSDQFFGDIRAQVLRASRSGQAVDIREIELGDPEFFEDLSFTISYDPIEQTFVSLHTWTPDFMFSARDHFFTVKGGGLYKHNHRRDAFCNFYGEDHEFLVELPEATGNAVTSLSSIEYVLENYRYLNAHSVQTASMLDFNFDRAMIYNRAQNSGWLKLVLKPKNNPVKTLEYPKLVPGLYHEILYSQEEGKFRFNQFSDLTDDAGEFTAGERAMFVEGSPSAKILNANYVDLNKPATQRKKFRNEENRILLKRTISGPVNMVFRFIENKKILSPR